MDGIFSGGRPVRGALERLFIAGGNASAALPVKNDSRFGVQPAAGAL